MMRELQRSRSHDAAGIDKLRKVSIAGEASETCSSALLDLSDLFGTRS